MWGHQRISSGDENQEEIAPPSWISRQPNPHKELFSSPWLQNAVIGAVLMVLLCFCQASAGEWSSSTIAPAGSASSAMAAGLLVVDDAPGGCGMLWMLSCLGLMASTWRWWWVCGIHKAEVRSVTAPTGPQSKGLREQVKSKWSFVHFE